MCPFVEDRVPRDRGVVFVAYGRQHHREVQLAASSFKRHCPHVPITVFSDEPLDAPFFDEVRVNECAEELKHYFRDTDRMPSVKVLFLRRTPYRKTLYFDTDVYFRDDVSELFRLLDGNDLLLVRSPHIDVPNRTFLSYTSPRLNAACAGYRMTIKMQEFFSRWWSAFVARQQGANRHTGNRMCEGGLNEETVLAEIRHDLCRQLQIRLTALDARVYGAIPAMWTKMVHDGCWASAKVLHAHGLVDAIPTVGVGGLPGLPYPCEFRWRP